MIIKNLLYFVGIFLCSISLTIVVIYFNLVIYGCSLLEYIRIIFKTWEFYLLIPGLYLLKKDRLY